MNVALVSLELRKNRLTLIGLSASFALVPLLALLVGPRQGLTAGASIDAGLVLWTAAGLPLAAALFGASAGAGLRSSAVRDAEAGLPGSPAGRVLRGLAGATLQFLILAAGSALISAVLSQGWRGGALGVGEAPKVWAQAAPWRGLTVFFAVEILASSFVASYALGHAVAGGLLGVAVSAVEVGALTFGLGYGIFFADRVASFLPLAFLVGAAGLATKAAALRPLSSRFERLAPLGLGGALGAGALFLAGAVVAVGAQESVFVSLVHSLRMTRESSNTLEFYRGPSSVDEAQARFPAIRRAGALAQEIDGGLDWISPDGRVKRLLRPVSRGRATPFAPADWTHVSALWDKDGRLFVLRSVDLAGRTITELWSGRPDSGLSKAEGGLNINGLSRADGRVHVKGWTYFKSQDCAYGADGAPSCVDDPPYRPDPSRRVGTAAGPRDRFAAVGADGRRHEWKLPGRLAQGVSPDDIRFPYIVGGKPAWFVPVQTDDGQGVALCREGGRVDHIWNTGPGMLLPIGGIDLKVLPDGTITHNYGYDFDVIDPAGQVLPPIKTKKLFERWPRAADAPPHTPVLVRRAGGHAWFVFESDRLVEMEEGTGMPVRDWRLPVATDFPSILDGGIVIEAARGAPYFIAWDGTTRALRVP